MPPKTMRRSKILTVLFISIVLVQCLSAGCLNGRIQIGGDACRQFFQSFHASLNADALIGFTIGIFMVVLLLNMSVGSLLEWRGLMALYRRLAETRGAKSTFSRWGKVRADISLNVEGMPLRLFVERAFIDRYGLEYEERHLIDENPLEGRRRYGEQHRVRLVFTAPQPFSDPFRLILKQPVLSFRGNQNIDEQKLKKRLRFLLGTREAAERWIKNIDIAALADLDVMILEQIEVKDREFSLIVARIPDDMDKIDAVLKASARLYRDFLAVDGQGTMAQFYKI